MLHPTYECNQFNYDCWFVTGKLNYLAKSARPAIIFAAHLLARFSIDPHKDHDIAMMHLRMHLNHTKLWHQVKNPTGKGFKCYAEADFAGAFSKEHSDEDPVVAKSKSGWYII